MCKTSKLNSSYTNIIQPLLKGYDLWKIGLYFSNRDDINNGEQGTTIEKIFCELLKANNVKDKEVNQQRKKGVILKYDFVLSDGLQVEFKSSVRKKDMFKPNGDVRYNHNSIKIFDTSRNVYYGDQITVLYYLLEEINWELNIMLYLYEEETNKGCLCLTSLSEISKFLFVDNSVGNILKLFSYSKGGSHYFIDRGDIYNTSKHHNRVIYFGENDEVITNTYLSDKLKPINVVDMVF